MITSYVLVGEQHVIATVIDDDIDPRIVKNVVVVALEIAAGFHHGRRDFNHNLFFSSGCRLADPTLMPLARPITRALLGSG